MNIITEIKKIAKNKKSSVLFTFFFLKISKTKTNVAGKIAR